MSYVKGLGADIKWDAELRNNKTSVPSAVNCEQLKSSWLPFDATKQGMQSLMFTICTRTNDALVVENLIDRTDEQVEVCIHSKKRNNVINHGRKVYMMNVKRVDWWSVTKWWSGRCTKWRLFTVSSRRRSEKCLKKINTVQFIFSWRRFLFRVMWSMEQKPI